MPAAAVAAASVIVAGLLLPSAPRALHPTTQHVTFVPYMLAAEGGDSDDATFATCMKMKVSEMKAELDLRSISYEG